MLRLQVQQAVLARLRVAVTDGLPHDERDVAVLDRVDRGGFFLPECADLDEAIALAAQIPAAENGAVEVRRSSRWDCPLSETGALALSAPQRALLHRRRDR